MAHAARVHVLVGTSCDVACLEQMAVFLGDRFGAGQGECVVAIVDVEDPSWNPEQANLSGSGAYGIPQALPGDQMESAGADWATDGVTQLKWMTGDYIAERYGTPCNALAHERADDWY